MVSEDNFPADLGMVPTGTMCDRNMVRKLNMLLLTISKTTIDSKSVHCVNVLTMFSSVWQVCYNQQCQDIKKIKEYGTNDCSAKCNNRGVKKKSVYFPKLWCA